MGPQPSSDSGTPCGQRSRARELLCPMGSKTLRGRMAPPPPTEPSLPGRSYIGSDEENRRRKHQTNERMNERTTDIFAKAERSTKDEQWRTRRRSTIISEERPSSRSAFLSPSPLLQCCHLDPPLAFSFSLLTNKWQRGTTDDAMMQRQGAGVCLSSIS